MEVVSAVASIVGIAGFTGQAINGLQKLYNLFEDCRNASKTADRFLRDVASLTEALKDVETFLAKAQSLSNALHKTDLASLTINVEDCSKNVVEWVKEAEVMSSSLRGTNSRFKKFVAAVKKQGVRDVFEQIGSHKSTIMLSLSATGRLLDAYNCSQSDVLVSKVGEATSYGKVTVEALSRLESMMEVPKSYEQDALRTSKSLSSIASAVSRIESLFSRQFPVPILPTTYNSGSFGMNEPQDVHQASRLAAEKRRRNEGASARFRQRRKDKEKEASMNIKKLQQQTEDLERQVREVDQARNFYRAERDRLQDYVSRSTEMRHLTLQAPRSPQLGSASSVPRSRQQLGSLPPAFQGTIPASIGEYTKRSLTTQHCRAHLRMLSALVDNLDGADPELEDSYIKAKEQLADEILRLGECRTANWNDGHDLDGLDRTMEIQVYTDKGPCEISFERYSSSESQPKPWWDVLHYTISQGWITRTDRINSWLLQNLASIPEEANRHRMLIPDGEQLGEEQWARLVLKFWPLDGAAPRFGLSSCSTNGAVDSAGACHSARVLLSEMPFNIESEVEMMDDSLPIRRKRSGVSEGKGSDILRPAKRRRVEEESGSP